MTIPIQKSTKAMVHGYHIRNNDLNAVVVKEKICNLHTNGTYSYEDSLNILHDPVRPYWVTKPEHRTHRFKKEFEYGDKLDRYLVSDSMMASSIRNNLNLNSRRLRDLYDSPYLYGASIESAVFIRHKYNKEQDIDIPVKYTVGTLDIENEIYGDERIMVVSFMHEYTIYTAMLKEYMVIRDKVNGDRPATVDHVLQRANELLGPVLTRENIQLTTHVADTELELLTWIFQQIHRCKTDFIGVWNIRHDVPHILKRLAALDANIPDTICHPDVPPELREYYYRLDNNKKLQHFTDRWDWFSCAGYSQFVDAMCLYSRIRKTRGRKPSYSLDNISAEELGARKLSLNPQGDHTWEQQNNFVDYVVYNMNDVILPQLLEKKNNDYVQLISLSGATMLKDFNKQTAMDANGTFFDAILSNKITCACGNDMTNMYDKMMPKSGGAVLNPNRTIGIGVDIILEAPTIETKACVCVNDLDVASEYPSIISAFNISKETKQDTVIEIEGYGVAAVEQFFTNIVSPIENASWLVPYFFNFPNYQELETLLSDYISTRWNDRLPVKLDPENSARDRSTVDGILRTMVNKKI